MRALRRFAFLLSLAGALSLPAHAVDPPCVHCAEWNTPQKPFRIYGNTYYIGPHGLSSVLITSDSGHVLIDGALAESVPQIVANIKSVGFRIEDVKLIVNSHAHFDHAGGIAELQRLSGAQIVVSPWTAGVLKAGRVSSSDPQYGIIRATPRVARVKTLNDGQTLQVGPLAVTAHLTPGHTPGGTSWTWQSCDGGRCLNLVYADSLTPVSADGFQFTHSRKYPRAIADFEKSIAFLTTVPCDIPLSAHGDASRMWDRLDAREKGVLPDPMIDPSGCRQMADRSRDALQKRITGETGQKPAQ